jgi:hypothetical protein
MLYVQHTRGRLDKHTDVSIHRRMYEPGRIMGKGEESYGTLEIAEQFLDCNRERFTRIFTKSNGRGDQRTMSPSIG